ncbi:hypothetical protein CKM354_001295600 [Cercospora kikuchii]|uniref:Hydrophobin n=1 Tax=Cercospora kikuchii TaxID=84275 RepID=A0A9P3FMZ8_9PEZI|nr:uncharacterized protein CKM354_001295600 [Cercospora kikuchii]GIZ49940.1 hypothetical protein CKM354_001295600 [Cercospora kikuchii]
MQFLLLAIASMAIATPVVQKREAEAEANTGLAARQFEAYGGYYPQGQGPNIYNGNGNGNSGDGNGNSGSGNGNSGNNSGNGNGNNGNVGGDDDNNNNNDDETVGGDDDNVGGDDGDNGGDDNTDPVNPCGDALYSNPQCCGTGVLDLLDLDCDNTPFSIASRADFIDQCSNIGQQARCCVLPVLGQALLCQDPLV